LKQHPTFSMLSSPREGDFLLLFLPLEIRRLKG